MAMLPRFAFPLRWSPSCTAIVPFRSEVRRWSDWAESGEGRWCRAEALAATNSTAARETDRIRGTGLRKLRWLVRAFIRSRILEFLARADVADGCGALQANVRVRILLHALAEHVHAVIVGVHLAVRGHIAQRIHGFDAHAGILVIHQRIEQRLAGRFLRAGAV